MQAAARAAFGGSRSQRTAGAGLSLPFEMK